MPPSKTRRIAAVLSQPGAQAFFAPVLPQLRERGWDVAVVNGKDTDFNRIGELGLSAVIVSASYNLSEKRAIAWAAARGVPSLQLVDSWYDYRRRIELTNGEGLLPDEIFVFDEDARKDAMSEGLPAERLRVVGNPAWEAVAPLPKAPQSNLLVVDQPVAADMGRRLGYDEDDFIRVIHAGIKDDDAGKLRLNLAPHPRRSSPLSTNQGTRVVGDIREAVRQCGTVIGMFSSFLVDAFLAGRRVVSVQPGAGTEDFCILSRLGLVPRVTKAHDFRGALDTSQPGPRDFARRFAHSRERVIAALEEVAAKSQ